MLPKHCVCFRRPQPTFVTSALDSTNVKNAFELVIQEIYNNVRRKVLNSNSCKSELPVNRTCSKRLGPVLQCQEPRDCELIQVCRLVCQSTLRLQICKRKRSMILGWSDGTQCLAAG
ncbi:hypothetical protein Leryth_006268 [Lithospermum erythrorhizon]|nr:hypothetical protein Leryth_006268 [Lithospermum erythrorhizon]